MSQGTTRRTATRTVTPTSRRAPCAQPHDASTLRRGLAVLEVLSSRKSIVATAGSGRPSTRRGMSMRRNVARDSVAGGPPRSGGLQISSLLPRFTAERFLYDYLDDAKLLTRLNQVMRRASLPLLPPGIAELFPAMRERVRERRAQLLP